MGVGKFYRWLSERYPLINQNLDDFTLLPEIDNLYLDMNGILHNATHGNDGISRVLTETEVMLKMCAYIDNMVKLVQPQQILYMAIDGVAPRAKMNQQRSRRFRAAKDLAKAREEARARGEVVSDAEVFDSNCITPGTEFMANISGHLKFFVRKKIRDDPVWRRVKVIFSGHEVPGEGEHKIMDFIRGIKSQPGYNPNTRHCMAGADADLIMLSLACHEPHFTLLREHIDFTSFLRNKHATKENIRQTEQTKWQLLHIGLLREYLEIDMKPANVADMPFAYDGEAVIDDFVLLTALCGNDFIPHLPSLDIGEGAIDHLIKAYNDHLPTLGGYLVEGAGKINFSRLEKLIEVVAAMETDVLLEREAALSRWKDKMRRERRKRAALGYEVDDESDSESSVDELADDDPLSKFITEEKPDDSSPSESSDIYSGDIDSTPISESSEDLHQSSSLVKSIPKDDLKSRYYLNKFGFLPGSDALADLKHRLVQSFVEAMQWVMYYYYQGCPSWSWFYPFHYSPMTSDLVNLSEYDVTFHLGKPFKPFEQLLGCLPAASAKFLPPSYRALMATSGPLGEYYPHISDIKIDMEGKKNPWEGVTLIPFMRETTLLDAIAEHCPDHTLSEIERQRNAFGSDIIMSHDPSSTDAITSTLPSVFTDIVGSESTVVHFQNASIPGDGVFVPRPCKGCVVPAAGYPTLHDTEITAQRISVSMQVLSRRSRMESVILAVGDGRRMQARGAYDHQLKDGEAFPAHKPSFGSIYRTLQCSQEDNTLSVKEFRLQTQNREAIEIGQEILGNVLLVDWPYLREALIVGVSDMTCSLEWENIQDMPKHAAKNLLSLNDGVVKVQRHNAEAQQFWQDKCLHLQKTLLAGGNYLSRAGIRVGDVKLVVKARKLVGMRRDAETGSLHRVWAKSGSEGEIEIPAQLLFRHHPAADPRFTEQAPAPIEKRFPIGSTVLLLSGDMRGNTATVKGYNSDEKASTNIQPTLHLETTARKEPTEFGRELAHKLQDKYFTFQAAAEAVGLSRAMFGKITGSIIVRGANPSAHKKYNDYVDIGLNLKVKRSGLLYLPGYTRPSQQGQAWGSRAQTMEDVGSATRTGWEFTKRALDLVSAYIQQHKIVFDILEKSDRAYYQVSDFGGGATLERITNWLAQLDTYKKPLVPLTTQVMSPQAVVALQQAADVFGKGRRQQAVAHPPQVIDLPSVSIDQVFVQDPFGHAVGGIGGADALGNATSSHPNVSSKNRTNIKNGVPRLGDRVCNLAYRTLPVGTRGTVVAIHASTGYVEILWDIIHVGGTDLNGLCSHGRGGLLSWAHVLKLSSDSVDNTSAEQFTKNQDVAGHQNSTSWRSSRPRNKPNNQSYHTSVMPISEALEELFVRATEPIATKHSSPLISEKDVDSLRDYLSGPARRHGYVPMGFLETLPIATKLGICADDIRKAASTKACSLQMSTDAVRRPKIKGVYVPPSLWKLPQNSSQNHLRKEPTSNRFDTTKSATSRTGKSLFGPGVNRNDKFKSFDGKDRTGKTFSPSVAQLFAATSAAVPSERQSSNNTSSGNDASMEEYFAALRLNSSPAPKSNTSISETSGSKNQTSKQAATSAVDPPAKNASHGQDARQPHQEAQRIRRKANGATSNFVPSQVLRRHH